MSQHKGPFQIVDLRLNAKAPTRETPLRRYGGGELSYNCKKDRHSVCSKLSCPCQCHGQELK